MDTAVATTRIRTSLASSCVLSSLKIGALVVGLVASAGALAVSIDSPGWLAAVTLFPVLLAIRSLRPLSAAACGAVWGASLFTFLWINGHALGSSLVLSAALLAGAPAAYAFLGSVFTRRFGFSSLMLGFGWAGVELALLPLGLKGGLLFGQFGANAAGFVGVLQGVLGFVFLASFIAAVNGLLLSALSRAYVRVRGTRRSYACGASNLLNRIFPRDDLFELFRYVNPTHARAPPA